jgi:hypothetical protein
MKAKIIFHFGKETVMGKLITGKEGHKTYNFKRKKK